MERARQDSIFKERLRKWKIKEERVSRDFYHFVEDEGKEQEREESLRKEHEKIVQMHHQYDRFVSYEEFYLDRERWKAGRNRILGRERADDEKVFGREGESIFRTAQNEIERIVAPVLDATCFPCRTVVESAVQEVVQDEEMRRPLASGVSFSMTMKQVPSKPRLSSSSFGDVDEVDDVDENGSETGVGEPVVQLPKIGGRERESVLRKNGVFIPLDLSKEELIASGLDVQQAEEKMREIKRFRLETLAKAIPVDREDVFSFDICWSVLKEDGGFYSRLLQWLKKKLAEGLRGENEEHISNLCSLVYHSIRLQVSARKLVNDLEEHFRMPCGDSICTTAAELFVYKLWRYLILESENLLATK